MANPVYGMMDSARDTVNSGTPRRQGWLYQLSLDVTCVTPGHCKTVGTLDIGMSYSP